MVVLSFDTNLNSKANQKKRQRLHELTEKNSENISRAGRPKNIKKWDPDELREFRHLTDYFQVLADQRENERIELQKKAEKIKQESKNFKSLKAAVAEYYQWLKQSIGSQHYQRKLKDMLAEKHLADILPADDAETKTERPGSVKKTNRSTLIIGGHDYE